jgi:hypothetical protein
MGDKHPKAASPIRHHFGRQEEAAGSVGGALNGSLEKIILFEALDRAKNTSEYFREQCHAKARGIENLSGRNGSFLSLTRIDWKSANGKPRAERSNLRDGLSVPAQAN